LKTSPEIIRLAVMLYQAAEEVIPRPGLRNMIHFRHGYGG